MSEISLETLALAKKYTDEHGGEGGGGDKVSQKTLAVAKTYTDDKDAENLASAKSYSDTQDAATLKAAKDYTNNSTLNSYIVTDGTEGTITIGTGWSETDPHIITVTAQDYTITSKTMVSILPHAGTIVQMREDGVQTMYITNNNGTLTAYAIGNKPTAAMTVPVLYTEVE